MNDKQILESYGTMTYDNKGWYLKCADGRPFDNSFWGNSVGPAPDILVTSMLAAVRVSLLREITR